jgi:hypothetical protein
MHAPETPWSRPDRALRGLFFVVGVVSTSGASAQTAPPVVWERNFGGPDADWGRCVRETVDGGFILTGLIDDGPLSGRLFLLKTDAAGNPVWQRDFGGARIAEGISVVAAGDGTFVATGAIGGTVPSVSTAPFHGELASRTRMSISSKRTPTESRFGNAASEALDRTRGCRFDRWTMAGTSS